MKRIVLLLFIQCCAVAFAKAQSGTGSNSDWKVPIPAISPQIDPAPVTNQIIVSNMPLINTPAVSIVAGYDAQNLLPRVPITPDVPSVPVTGDPPAPPAIALKTKIPGVNLLPPLPTIRISPVVKMPATSFFN